MLNRVVLLFPNPVEIVVDSGDLDIAGSHTFRAADLTNMLTIDKFARQIYNIFLLEPGLLGNNIFFKKTLLFLFWILLTLF